MSLVQVELREYVKLGSQVFSVETGSSGVSLRHHRYLALHKQVSMGTAVVTVSVCLFIKSHLSFCLS